MCEAPCAEQEMILSVLNQGGGPLSVLNPKGGLLCQAREEALCAEPERRVSVQVYIPTLYNYPIYWFQ